MAGLLRENEGQASRHAAGGGGEWLERMEAHNGAAYQTAIAVLILSVPANYLLIYQR